jgi:hypothetical protein
MGSTTYERDWYELHSDGLCIRNISCKDVVPTAQKTHLSMLCRHHQCYNIISLRQ